MILQEDIIVVKYDCYKESNNETISKIREEGEISCSGKYLTKSCLEELVQLLTDKDRDGILSGES